MTLNQDRINIIEFRIAQYERQQARGLRVSLNAIGCRESEMNSVWQMSFEEDRVRLNELRTRLNMTRRYSLSHPEPEMPPIIHIFG
jgi:hypothetical protein